MVTGDHFIRCSDDDDAEEADDGDVETTPSGSEGMLDEATDSEGLYASVLLVRVAFVLLDRATGWVQCFPQASTHAEHTAEAVRQFAGPDKILNFRADGASEITAAARALGWPCDTSTPFVHQTNGVAERAVRLVKDGGRCSNPVCVLHGGRGHACISAQCTTTGMVRLRSVTWKILSGCASRLVP